MSNEGSGEGGAWQLRPGVPARSAPVPKPRGQTKAAVSPEAFEALKKAKVFATFTDTGIQIMASIAHEKTLPPNTPLFVENMLGESLFVVVEGTLRVSVKGPDGAEQKLCVLGEGESLGEAALLRSGPRLCSATAETPVKVLEITRRDIIALQAKKPQACMKLMMNVVELVGTRLKDAEPEMKRFATFRVTGR
ncbi:MAG: cyclic nucleotide-binding domain-containing protein [Deltaproteobacteria bacterium]|nr:cyclic nucleotide-binding domain-containing protein [Deltaproteobacteria bacterium]